MALGGLAQREADGEEAQVASEVLHATHVTPMRTVYHCDAVAWLREQPVLDGCVVTSLPDICEVVPKMTVAEYKTWFADVVELIVSRLRPNMVAIFYQTDVKHVTDTVQYIDKSHLCQLGANRAQVSQLWHRIALTVPPDALRGTQTGYTHLLAFSPEYRDSPERSAHLPDTLSHRGGMVWLRGMGLKACVDLVQYCYHVCRHEGVEGVIVDPFCGMGSVLAVANEFNMKAVGVDLSANHCRKASRLITRAFEAYGSIGARRAFARQQGLPTPAKRTTPDDGKLYTYAT